MEHRMNGTENNLNSNTNANTNRAPANSNAPSANANSNPNPNPNSKLNPNTINNTLPPKIPTSSSDVPINLAQKNESASLFATPAKNVNNTNSKANQTTNLTSPSNTKDKFLTMPKGSPTNTLLANSSDTKQGDDKAKQIRPTSKTDSLILQYLRQKGYKFAERSLLEKDLPNAANAASAKDAEENDIALAEADVSEQFQNVLLRICNHSGVASSGAAANATSNAAAARRVEEAFADLRNWVDGSLDLYKGELHTVLYPLLVHCFLELVRKGFPVESRAFLSRWGAEFASDSGISSAPARREELIALAGVSLPQHLSENKVALLFLNNRYEILLSSYSFEMLLSLLTDDPRRTILLRMLNQHCRIQLDAKLTDKSRAGFKLTPDGENREKIGGFLQSNQQNLLLDREVLWGVLKESEYMQKEQENEDEEGKPQNENEDEEAEEKKKRKLPPHVESDGTLSESLVPLPKYKIGAAVLVNRPSVTQKNKLSTTALPSCLMYTFANTRSIGLNCLTMSHDASIICGGFGDSMIRIWDLKGVGSSAPISTLVGHAGSVYCSDLSSCSRFLLSGSEDGSVRLWSTALQTDLVAYRGHNYPVWSVEFSPLMHYFASGGHDRTARIWSTNRIYPLRFLAGHLADVDVVKWHPNCNYLGTGSSDRTARLWDIRSGDCTRIFGPQGGTIHSLAFSPDGRKLAIAGDANDIEIWDIAEGKQITMLQGHSSIVWSLEYSLDGQILASGGADCTARVWDGSCGGSAASAERAKLAGEKNTKAGHLLTTFYTKKTPVYTVKFTKKNLMVAAGAFSPM